MSKGDFAFWLGCFTLVVAFLAFAIAVYALRSKRVPNVYYMCCDHCYTEAGDWVNPDEHTVNRHEAPCNEPGCVAGLVEVYVYV